MHLRRSLRFSFVAFWSFVGTNAFSLANGGRGVGGRVPLESAGSSSRSSAGFRPKGSSEDDDMGGTPLFATKDVVSKVAVAGATGRTGELVVKELLRREVAVVAMVRSLEKAKEIFPETGDGTTTMLEIVACDLTNEEAIAKAVKDCDAAIWCATGFSDAKAPLLERIKRLFGIALAPKQSIDSIGVPALGKAMLEQVIGTKDPKNLGAAYPKVIMCSSAGVTRPSWDDAKKKSLQGCADIPIVRLNPFGILDVKAESEQKLRETGELSLSFTLFINFGSNSCRAFCSFVLTLVDNFFV